MAKNQRQRRPLQDDTRQNKQTVRERAQVSKRQRDRIEENRDRREQRRERNRSRRQIVDSVRSPKEDVRIDRMDSRLVPVEDTFLGRPVGVPSELPVLIGERWSLGASGQTISNNTEETIDFTLSKYTTERNGYPALYQGSGLWRIPAGLAGIWEVTFSCTWSALSVGGTRTIWLEYTDNTVIAYSAFDGESQSGVVTTTWQFQEGDEFRFSGQQTSGADLDMLGSADQSFSYAILTFLGK